MKWWPDFLMYLRRRTSVVLGTILIKTTDLWNSSFGTDVVSADSFKSLKDGDFMVNNSYMTATAVMPIDVPVDLDDFQQFTAVFKIRGIVPDNTGVSCRIRLSDGSGVAGERVVEVFKFNAGDYPVSLNINSSLEDSSFGANLALSVEITAGFFEEWDSLEVVVPVGTYI